MPLNHLLKPCFILKKLKSQIFCYILKSNEQQLCIHELLCGTPRPPTEGPLGFQKGANAPAAPQKNWYTLLTDSQRYTDIKQYTTEFPNVVTTFHDFFKHLPEIKVLPAAWGYQSRSTKWLPPHKMAASPMAILSSNMKIHFSIWTRVAEQRQLLITGSHFSGFGMLFKEDLLENKMRCILTHSSEEIR